MYAEAFLKNYIYSQLMWCRIYTIVAIKYSVSNFYMIDDRFFVVALSRLLSVVYHLEQLESLKDKRKRVF